MMLPCPTLVLIAQSIHKTTLSFGLQVLQVPFLWQSIPDKAFIKRKTSDVRGLCFLLYFYYSG